MSETRRNVPKLRFPGFTEDWEQRKLTDISKTFIGLVTTMTTNYRETGTLLIRNSDIRDNKFIFSEKPIYLDSEFAKSNESRKLKSGDVVTVHTGDIGTSAVVEEDVEGAIGFATINTRPDINYLDPHFLSTYFNTERHKKYAISVATGDGRSNYNIKDFNKLMLYMPSVNEQKAIAEFIKRITNLITLHQRKLENLKLKKKALLQKLFPKNGEQFPELRFPGFTDAWELRKLCEVVEITMGQSPSSKNYTDNPKDFILVQGNADLKNGAVVPRLWTKEVTKTAEANSIILTVRAPVGEVAISDYDVVLGRGVAGIKGNEFIYYVLLRLKEFHYWEKLSSGSTFDSINSNDIREILINVPSEKEQEAITSQLQGVDNLITLHQRKLEHLQLQKKALLQQMFV